MVFNWDTSVNRNDNSTAFHKINCVSFIDEKCWPPNSRSQTLQEQRAPENTSPETALFFIYFFQRTSYSLHVRKHIRRWSHCLEKYEKLHIKKSRRTSDYVHLFFPPPTPQFLSKLTNFFHCFCKFIKQLHKHCLFIPSTMVKWVYSGLRKTTSTDVFHHCYRTRNVTRKEGSMAERISPPWSPRLPQWRREYIDSSLTMSAPWRTRLLAPELQGNLSALY